MMSTEVEPDSAEIWETTTGGMVWVNVRDPQNARLWTQRRVGGGGSKRLPITAEERRANQELIPYESRHQDPFTNGLLVRISPPPEPGEADASWTDERLVQILTQGSDEGFEVEVGAIESEVILRRMLFLAERNATMFRYNILKDIVETRYAIGKTSQVAAEAAADEGRGADL